MTYEDGQRIENDTNDLNRVASNLPHLVGKQTHVIRAQFEEMHGKLEAYEKHQKEFRSQLMSIQEGMYQVSASLHKLNYTQMLTSTLHALEMELDEHLWAADRLLDIVYSARGGMLHASLLTPEQIEPIFRDIQDHSPMAVFPIPGPIMSIEDLAKIATTTIACGNERLKVCLNIPLVDKTDYTLYQLQPVPVIQSILRNGSGRALPWRSHAGPIF